MLVFLPLLLRFFGRVNPIKFFKNIVSVILMAFSTQSSACLIYTSPMPSLCTRPPWATHGWWAWGRRPAPWSRASVQTSSLQLSLIHICLSILVNGDRIEALAPAGDEGAGYEKIDLWG